MNIKEWTLSYKLVTIAFAVAVFSLLMPWADALFITQNGFQQHGYIFLVVFIYPLIVVLKKLHFNKIFGYINAAVGVVGIFVYINSMTVDFFGEKANFTSTGAYLFLATIIVLAVAVFLDKKTEA